MQFDTAATRLTVILEADPSALVRVLQFFQSRNVVPTHVSARRTCDGWLEIEIGVGANEISSDAMRVITAKVRALSCARSACAIRTES